MNTIWKAGVGDNVSRTQRRPPLLPSGPHTKEMDAQGAVTPCPSPERPAPSWGACPLPNPCRCPPRQPVHMLSWGAGVGPSGGQGKDLVHPRSERVKVTPNSSNRSRALARGSELRTSHCWGHAAWGHAAWGAGTSPSCSLRIPTGAGDRLSELRRKPSQTAASVTNKKIRKGCPILPDARATMGPCQGPEDHWLPVGAGSAGERVPRHPAAPVLSLPQPPACVSRKRLFLGSLATRMWGHPRLQLGSPLRIHHSPLTP